MSGHYLATTNKDAAEAIGKEEKRAAELPGIGETVRFYPRPGELRSGRGKYAALVTDAHEDGTLDLIVFFDVDDSISQKKVPMRNFDQPRGWEPIEGRNRSPLLPVADQSREFTLLEEKVKDLDAKLYELRKIIFGEFEAPEEPFVEILSDHEDRLIALEPQKKQKPKAKRKGK